MGDINLKDELYYVMDFSQNYYCLDSKNQLVIAKNKDAARIFSLQEVRSKLESKKKASFYRIVTVDGNKMVTSDMLFKMSTEKNNDEEVKREEAEYDISKIDWHEYLEQFCYLVSGSQKYFSDLQKQQSDVDMELSDLMHYVELFEVMPEEESKILEAIKDARSRRRKIMDSTEALKLFQDSIGNNANLIKTQKALKLLESMDERKYKPRILPELFKGAVPKRHYFTQEQQEINSEVVVEEKKEDRRVVHMSDVRRETVYDSKKVDWVQFAKDQVEFYKNAEQHLNNLRIDIKALDDEIEKILNQIEKSTFGAVQGYRIFKRLQDLRNSRSNKIAEYDAVSILIEPFDCVAMQEQFEYSLEEITGLSEENVAEKAEEVV